MTAVPNRQFPAPGDGEKPRAIRVLSVGREPELLHWRNDLMRRSGCVVSEARTVADAMALLGKPHDVIVFGHLVPQEERNHIAASAKSIQPGIRVIMLYLGAIRRAELADALLNVGGKPDDLLRTIELLAGERDAAAGAES